MTLLFDFGSGSLRSRRVFGKDNLRRAPCWPRPLSPSAPPERSESWVNSQGLRGSPGLRPPGRSSGPISALGRGAPQGKTTGAGTSGMVGVGDGDSEKGGIVTVMVTVTANTRVQM